MDACTSNTKRTLTQDLYADMPASGDAKRTLTHDLYADTPAKGDAKHSAAVPFDIQALPDVMLKRVLLYVPWQLARLVCRKWAAARPRPALALKQEQAAKAVAKMVCCAVEASRRELDKQYGPGVDPDVLAHVVAMHNRITAAACRGPYALQGALALDASLEVWSIWCVDSDPSLIGRLSYRSEPRLPSFTLNNLAAERKTWTRARGFALVKNDAENLHWFEHLTPLGKMSREDVALVHQLRQAFGCDVTAILGGIPFVFGEEHSSRPVQPRGPMPY